MTQSEIMELSTEELVERIAEEKAGLERAIINHKVSETENPISIRFSRRTVARLKTELRKRELAEAAK